MFRKGRSRVRRLRALGRVKETTWEGLIELSEDGTNYELSAAAEDGDDARAKAELWPTAFLLSQRGELTISQFEAAAGVSKSSARRRLGKMVNRGEAVVIRPGENGNGGKANV